MSGRNVLEPRCSRAYDRGENPFVGSTFPEPGVSGPTWLQLGGRARVLRVEDVPMWLLGPSFRVPLEHRWGSFQVGSDGR